MKILNWKLFFALVICLVVPTLLFAQNATTWRLLAPGLEYARLSGFTNFPTGSLHAFRIDLHHYFLRTALVLNEDSELPQTSFKKLMQTEHAVIASNGGFFTPEYQPLGLRISNGKMFSPLKAISWWYVFYTQYDQAFVTSQGEYSKGNTAVNFAIEAGPRLLVHGSVPPGLNPDLDARTALCVTNSGKVILLATESVLFSTADLAKLMAQPQHTGGLDCVDAMNLDGGHSTQLYTALPGFSLDVSSSARVADAVLVVPKK